MDKNKLNKFLFYANVVCLVFNGAKLATGDADMTTAVLFVLNAVAVYMLRSAK
jgi:hypothetical protein